MSQLPPIHVLLRTIRLGKCGNVGLIPNGLSSPKAMRQTLEALVSASLSRRPGANERRSVLLHNASLGAPPTRV